MLKMRQQLEYLQELPLMKYKYLELVLKDKLAWLEATNEDLCQELHEYCNRGTAMEQCETDAKVGRSYSVKSEGLKKGLQSYSGDIDEAAKETEHILLQDSMDKELTELNRRLEQKESEMKLFGGSDTMTLKHHFGKKIMELEDEKRIVQQERDHLLAEVENLAATSDGQKQKLHDMHAHKLKALEA
ncbi:unnamed protein product [Ilex paraguariensis]|uniref:Uncharacterized protein n=1 Tax=Ilex paraguariensis TaxID=185542 RepID=A0ABC8S1D6_9AQUA